MGMKTISLRDDFMGHRQAVHSHSRSPIMWFVIRAYFPRGGTLIFSLIRRLGPFFWVQNSEFQNLFWVFRKINVFWGYEDFVDIFWGSSQNWASLRVISMQIRDFFKVKVQNWDIFLGC